ncbi:MAG: hypothetical protein WCE79_21935 [Xanthobacteraceae bacterium]
MTIVREIQPRTLLAAAAFGATVALPTALWSAGDLSKQTAVEVTVDLGKPGEHAFVPREIRFETGKLYKLILRNPSDDPHYFTSDAFSGMVFTRKVQVTQAREGKTVTLAEFKGAIREIEVYPGHAAEWWFVPIAAGRIADLRCGIVAKDGKTHAQLGMTGEIVIE